MIHEYDEKTKCATCVMRPDGQKTWVCNETTFGGTRTGVRVVACENYKEEKP